MERPFAAAPFFLLRSVNYAPQKERSKEKIIGCFQFHVAGWRTVVFVLFPLAPRFYFRPMLSLVQALEIIESGQEFDLRFIKANTALKQGGEVCEFNSVKITRVPVRGTASEKLPGRSKAPSHHANFTRNVMLPNGGIRSFHPLLVTHINNIPVL